MSTAIAFAGWMVAAAPTAWAGGDPAARGGALAEQTAPPPQPGADPAGEADAKDGAPSAEPTSTAGDEAAAPTTVGEEAAAPATLAPLPPEGPPPPKPSEPRAWGGAVHTPLPQPPDDADPSTLKDTPWRGRFWVGVGLLASVPVAGRAPAAGGVVAVIGEVTLGWRVNRYLALHTAVSSFAHDAGERTVYLDDGTPLSEVELGRITAFDLVTARVFIPAHRRIEPWVEAGGGVGARRGPFAVERQAVGLLRVGTGVDFWLAPSLTLGASAAYRGIILGDTVGHGLRIGADLGLHW